MIYLDHSATTPVDPQVLRAMEPYFCTVFGNPSSIHSYGREALAAVDKARETVAAHLNCRPAEVVFTSGATEANNLAIKGLVKGLKEQGRERIHIITSLIEHDAVLEPCMEMEKQGITVTHIPPDRNGVVDPDRIAKALQEDTALVSLMYVNNEVGTVQPVKQVGKLIRKHNEKREREWKKLGKTERGERPQPVYLHTDATQALNFFGCDTDRDHIDLLSLSGHKIYGPKGVGALIAKEGVPLKAIQTGGHQEANRRSGTMNVCGIVGLGAAVGLLAPEARDKHNSEMERLRDRLADTLKRELPDTAVNSSPLYTTPSHLHISIPGTNGKAVQIALDQEGIAVSVASACAAGTYTASHVLAAMEVPPEAARGSLRITLGKHTTEEEIDRVGRVLPGIVKKQRTNN